MTRKAPPAESRPGRRRLRTALRIGVSAALLAWVLADTNVPDVARSIGRASLPVLGLAFSFNFVGYYLTAHRWRVLLRVQGIDPALPFLVRSCMAAMFFNNLLPSTVGGDLVRAYDSWKIGRTKSGAVATIAVDRLMGVLALLVLAQIGLVAAGGLFDGVRWIGVWAAASLGGIGLLIGAVFAPIHRHHGAGAGIAATWVTALPARLPGAIERLLSAVTAFRGRRDALAKAFLLSLVLQIEVIVQYYLIARALGLPLSLAQLGLIIPPSLFIMMVPVSINAIGIRENIFAYLFGLLAISSADAIAFAWLAYGIVVMHGVLGGIVYALRR